MRFGNIDVGPLGGGAGLPHHVLISVVASWS